MKELKNTYLVQRLNKPFNSEFDNPFSFGGGLLNGGLSKEAMSLLRPIFSFDYMGSAEFEFGAVPECLDKISININNYSTHEIKINKLPIYIICDDDIFSLISERIKELAKDKVRCKGYTYFPEALGFSKYFKKEDCKTIGWLELDNGFIFFTDKDAAEKTANIFGLTFKSETHATTKPTN